MKEPVFPNSKVGGDEPIRRHLRPPGEARHGDEVGGIPAACFDSPSTTGGQRSAEAEIPTQIANEGGLSLFCPRCGNPDLAEASGSVCPRCGFRLCPSC